MFETLDRGRWTRPTDKSAVYTEIEPGQEWGVRVTLIDNFARVEAIKGPKGIWYKGPQEYSAEVQPPTIIERLRRISFEDKVLAEVEKKRKVAAWHNG